MEDSVKARNISIPFGNSIQDTYALVELNPRAYEVWFQDNEGNVNFGQHITFQSGNPLEVGHNGIISSVVLQALISHLEGVSVGFDSEDTRDAIKFLKQAQNSLARRADDRQKRGVLGSQKV